MADFVVVLVTPDRGLLAVARAELDGAGIRYWVWNERIADLVAGAYNIMPIEIAVAPEDAEAALALLEPLLGEVSE
ncbi:MAG: putative signal transducing protein [Armatimonadota bacterium]